MDENRNMVEAAKALGLGELLPEAYRDILQPAARKLGQGLAVIAEAVNVSLAPLEASIWGYEQIKQWLSLRVTRIHADRGTTAVSPPPLSIAGPLVFHLYFAKDEPDLKELYASLLASAMDPTRSPPHPSFVSIIQQLTSDEARILRYLAHSEQKWPTISVVRDEGSSQPSVERQFKTWCNEAGVTHSGNSDVYLDNLVRLRILNHVIGNEPSYNPGNYDTPDPFISNAISEFVELTTLGRRLLDACVE